ncbi:MAG: vitamin B12 dependent methionine synthase [Candidatus Aminicenantes bacterium]|nr:vitamin B12 dependent methionine synthase [Candidatus Aminicenantes bacterium]
MPVLKNISVPLSPDYLIKHLRLDNKKDASAVVEELIASAEALVALKILYRISYIEERRADFVKIDGQTFSSSVLKKNLEKVKRVFPYIITIGKNLEDTASVLGDLLKQYYLEMTGDIALRLGKQHLEEHLKKKYGLEKVSSMSPGSLPNWPVTEQKPLFALMGDPERMVGVRLTDSMLMIPRKSISGIIFPTEVTFFSCQLCARERCEARKAPYDEVLKEKYDLSDA